MTRAKFRDDNLFSRNLFAALLTNANYFLHSNYYIGAMRGQENQSDLRSAVEAIIALTGQLQKTFSAAETAHDTRTKVVNALELAHDSASLIKAHSTKLSLLVINEPFTETAITTVLHELIAGPLLGLASSVQLCTEAKYTKAVSQDLQWRAKKVFLEFGVLVKAIPFNGQILSDDAKNGTGVIAGKGSLACTGVVWEACDEVIALKQLGIAGLMIQKAEGYRDLLKDALEELQEWEEEEESDEDQSNREDEGDDAQAAVDNVFNSERHIPPEDPDKIRPKLESFQKRLRLVVTMYTAVIKRRFKTLPKLPYDELVCELDESSKEELGIISCLDEVLDIMKKIPDITDELASAFYDLDSQEIDKWMDECFVKSFAAVELLLKNWEGQPDEFTEWVR